MKHRSTIARELEQPKYRQRIVPNRRPEPEAIEDLIFEASGESELLDPEFDD